MKSISQLWKHRATLGDGSLGRQEIDFLPAALEIKERPPHPATRVTACVLLVMFTIGVLWACIGEVDIVATAEGKIVPSGQVKQIQPYERGMVSAILVHEGQAVKAGDPLIELDQAQTGADSKRLTQELQQNRLNTYRLQQFQTFLNNDQVLDSSSNKPHSSNPSLVNWPRASEYQISQQQLLLEQEKQNFLAEQNRIEQLLKDKRAEKQVNQALINKWQGTLPLITERVDAVKKLLAKKMVSKAQYLELEQERVEQKHDLAAAKSTSMQLQAQINELAQQQVSMLAQMRAQNLQQLVDLEREYLNISEELKKAEDLNKKQILSSPVDGIVQELTIHTVGGVVTPAQPLMKIVPENQVLEVEAWLENKDIGFVTAGQNAELKVHTFPFTKYGIIDGVVTNISPDATADEQRGLIYKAHIKMDKNFLNVDGRNVDLVPGMSISAEVKTGKRLLIEYLIAPLLRYKNESLSER